MRRCRALCFAFDRAAAGGRNFGLGRNLRFKREFGKIPCQPLPRQRLAGTGDATIFLAEQLRATNAEIVHLDMSHASTALAQQRARMPRSERRIHRMDIAI